MMKLPSIIALLLLSCTLLFAAETDVAVGDMDGVPDISWSGYTWEVWNYMPPGERQDPGPNFFNPDFVKVQPDGALRLTVGPLPGLTNVWGSAEVNMPNALGYGVYEYTVRGRVDLLPKNVVLGLFTYSWDDLSEVTHEVSPWVGNGGKAQYWIHNRLGPAQYSFGGPLSANSIVKFTSIVDECYVKFETHVNGRLINVPENQAPAKGVAADEAYCSFMPKMDTSKVCLNLWLSGESGTKAPIGNKPVSVDIVSFKYSPCPAGGCKNMKASPMKSGATASGDDEDNSSNSNSNNSPSAGGGPAPGGSGAANNSDNGCSAKGGNCVAQATCVSASRDFYINNQFCNNGNVCCLN